MHLLTAELRAVLPPLRAQEGSADPMIYIRFYLPSYNWSWFVIEGEARGDDFLFFGYVVGVEQEWGYFSLRELELLRTVEGNQVILDKNFHPVSFNQLDASLLDNQRE